MDESTAWARVSTVKRDRLTAMDVDGRPIGDVWPAPGKAIGEYAVGDWIEVEGVETPRAIRTRPRTTLLIREAAGRGSDVQLLAANIDVVLIVEHLDPPPSARRVERLVTLAWASGATPLVVLAKADLVSDAAARVREIAAVAPGAPVLAVSAATGAGLAELRSELGEDRTFVLLGPSGAGKSTLVNALAGHEVMATGASRESDGKGRHTTTHRELVVVPGLGSLIDSPGVREVAVVADEGALERAFSDVDRFAAQCRFADCSHGPEPGCAVNSAIEDGVLDAARLASYRKLQREAAYHARRADKRLAAEDRAVWLARQRAYRERVKARGR